MVRTDGTNAPSPRSVGAKTVSTTGRNKAVSSSAEEAMPGVLLNKSTTKPNTNASTSNAQRAIVLGNIMIK